MEITVRFHKDPFSRAVFVCPNSDCLEINGGNLKMCEACAKKYLKDKQPIQRSIDEHLIGDRSMADLALAVHKRRVIEAFIGFLSERPNSTVAEVIQELRGVL